ncbi:MAG TPA: glycoside hydrolase family 38 C-terminal domain-containing protein [Candidatus Limnocylindrales bacterium]|nr:glycoside hydrolase family 38 C-terminal domain-containing protein [Candidatus Limnocylindrales bacterium]
MPDTSEVAITTIHFVPHTHWDREWYQPFQVFRMRLIALVDDVLNHLEREPAFRFTLDGQLATIDDYLEVRPQAEERIRHFVAEGRLAIGPWQILMDEFLVSGETIVRNLQRGWQRALAFGAPMSIGYLPDMFGHIAQMPQILRRAGIDRAVVWRGVPAQVTRNVFRWRAPDGSDVVTEYLVGGYGNAAYLLEVPGAAADKVTGYRKAFGPWYGDESLLAMYGTDHMSPVPEMVALLEGVNAADSGVKVVIETLADYMAGRGDGDGDGGHLLVEGELRSAAHSNMLMGVNSAHIDIKAAAARAERGLSRYAEPLAALHGDEWPERLLELGWQRVIDSSAHDSICGCSVDPVAAQVLVRLDEAAQIAGEIAAQTARRVAMSVPHGDWLWLNPTPAARSGLVELDVLAADDTPEVALQLADGRLLATQEVDRNSPLMLETELRASEVGTFLRRRMHGRELFGKQLNAATVTSGTVTLVLDSEADPEWLDVDQLRTEIEAAVTAAPEENWRVRVISAGRRRVRAMVPAPPLGWSSGRPVGGSGTLEEPVRVSGRSLDNGLVSVSVEADGTLTIVRDSITVSGIGRLVDGGDAGDSYNYAPPFEDRMIESSGTQPTLIMASGPVVGELLIRRAYALPVGLNADHRSRSARTVETEIDMHVVLRAGEPFVRIRLAFDNQADDHRLRLHLPLVEPTDHSSSEGQYAVVRRGLTCEAGHGEVPLPTFPAYGWVDAGGVGILLDHVTEYELIDGSQLALTCLRSIGMISRNDNPYREDPAGPERPMPAAQLRGRREFSIGVLVHGKAWHAADVIGAAEQYAHDFVVASGTKRRDRTPAESSGGLSVSGSGVVTTALRRVGDWLELRVVAESPTATEATIGDGLTAAREVDLLGRIVAGLAIADGSLRVPLEPWQIRTIQLHR